MIQTNYFYIFSRHKKLRISFRLQRDKTYMASTLETSERKGNDQIQACKQSYQAKEYMYYKFELTLKGMII